VEAVHAGQILSTTGRPLAVKAASSSRKPLFAVALSATNHKDDVRLSGALSKLIEACSDTACSMDKWLSRIESCGWLSHIKDVLTCACLVAQCINEEGLLLRWSLISLSLTLALFWS